MAARHIETGSTDQTIVFHCFDVNGDAVTLAYNSPGLSLSYRVDANGREGTPVSLTPIARDVAGTHQDGAITSKGNGKHEVDVPDAAFATASRVVTLVVSATSVTGDVLIETAEVSTTLTSAAVNAEVLDVLTTDTFAELAAVPAATSSLKDKLTYLFMMARNKVTQTATTRLLKADDGTTTVATETVSDDGTTFTKGEAS